LTQGKHFNTTHGYSGTPTYRAWEAMIRRTTNSRDTDYARYGGRGIKTCDRWLNSFENFLADMGEKPEPSRLYSINRLDNNGHYTPENCEWTTWDKQNRNYSRNHLITFNGKTLCFTDWAQQIGISEFGLYYRLKYWTLEKALTTPSNRRSKN